VTAGDRRAAGKAAVTVAPVTVTRTTAAVRAGFPGPAAFRVPLTDPTVIFNYTFSIYNHVFLLVKIVLYLWNLSLERL